MLAGRLELFPMLILFLSVYLEEREDKAVHREKKGLCVGGKLPGAEGKEKNGYDSQGFPKKQKDGIKSGCIS